MFTMNCENKICIKSSRWTESDDVCTRIKSFKLDYSAGRNT